MSWTSRLRASEAHNALLLSYDRSRTAGADCPLRRAEGRIQATGARAEPGRRAGAAPAAGATCPADRARRADQAGPRALEHSQAAWHGRHARQSGRRAARSASRRLWLCAAQRAPGRSAKTTFSFLPTRSTAPCRATRCWSRSSLPRPMDAAWAALCACWSGATRPSSASFITRGRDRARWATRLFPSTSA